MVGVVTGLHRTPAKRAPAEATTELFLLADEGVEGDHHVHPATLRQVVLTRHEVLDELGLHPGDVREQLTLMGAPELEAGDVLVFPSGGRLRLTRTRVPCSLMNKIRPGLKQELAGRGGWCARVLADGTVALGDRVELEREPYSAAIDAYLTAVTIWEEAGAHDLHGVIDEHERVLREDMSADRDHWRRFDRLSAIAVDAATEDQLADLTNHLDACR